MRNFDEFIENLQSHPGLQMRKALQDQIDEKLNRYYNALLLQRQIAELERPTVLAIKTYSEVIFRGGTFAPKVSGDIKHLLDEEYRHDLVSLNKPVDQDVLSRLLRSYVPFPGQFIQSHGKIRSFQNRSLIFLVRVCSTTVATLLLIGSILALYFVTDQDARLGLVIAFIVLFAIGLSVCTGATRDSIFAGTAAYVGVLIVFVSGNLSNGRLDRQNT